MATYRDIADSEVDQDSPGTVSLFSALARNPQAAFEGAAGAPRLARNVTALSGQSANLDFSGLDDFAGVIIHGALFSGADTKRLDIAFSDDGVTFGTTQTLFSLSDQGYNDNQVQFHVFIDTATGAYEGGYAAHTDLSDTIGNFSGTISGGGADVDVLRVAGVTTQRTMVFLEATGGTSTT